MPCSFLLWKVQIGTRICEVCVCRRARAVGQGWTPLSPWSLCGQRAEMRRPPGVSPPPPPPPQCPYHNYWWAPPWCLSINQGQKYSTSLGSFKNSNGWASGPEIVWVGLSFCFQKPRGDGTEELGGEPLAWSLCTGRLAGGRSRRHSPVVSPRRPRSVWLQWGMSDKAFSRLTSTGAKTGPNLRAERCHTHTHPQPQSYLITQQPLVMRFSVTRLHLWPGSTWHRPFPPASCWILLILPTLVLGKQVAGDTCSLNQYCGKNHACKV